MRRCPSCGHRFAVKSRGTKLVKSEGGTERIPRTFVVKAADPRGYGMNVAKVTYEDIPIERDSFEVAFECENCRHRWVETVTKVGKSK